MYDPMNPPDQGIPADPLPADLPEGDSGEVTDDDVEEPVFDAYAGTVDPVNPETLISSFVQDDEQDRIEGLMREGDSDDTQA